MSSTLKWKKKILNILWWCGQICLNIQIGVVIFVIVDAFRYIPGGLAETKCPDGLNDTFCSTAWKATSVLGIFYYIEAYLLSVIIYGITANRLPKTFKEWLEVCNTLFLSLFTTFFIDFAVIKINVVNYKT